VDLEVKLGAKKFNHNTLKNFIYQMFDPVYNANKKVTPILVDLLVCCYVTDDLLAKTCFRTKVNKVVRKRYKILKKT
jgi:hypothetical protein